jgi:capsular exopolysaccharide synthesis family protein
MLESNSSRIEQHKASGRMLAESPRAERLTVSGNPAMADRPSMEVLLMVWRGRWIMATCVIAALILGNIYFSRQTPIYSSSSVICLQQDVPNIISDVMSTKGESAGYLFTQCQVIHSTAILSSALKNPNVSAASCLQGVENPVAMLKNSVVAGPANQGDLITIAMESTRPEDAAVIVNGVVDAYISYLSEQHKSTAVEVVQILQNEMKVREAELQKDQQQILDFKRANPNLAIAIDAGKALPGRFAALSEALTQAQMRTMEVKVAVGQAKNAKDDPVQLKRILDHVDSLPNTSDGVDVAVDPGLAAAYQAAELQALNQQATLGEKSAALKETQMRLQLLRQQLQSERQAAADTYMSMLTAELDMATQREDALKKAVDEVRPEAIDLNAKQAEYDQLVQQADNTQRALDMLDSRIKAVNVTDDIGHLTATVLEKAEPVFTPVRPSRTHTMGMALVMGLMIGLGGTLLREMMEQHLTSPNEISNLLSLPILGAVPTIEADSGAGAATQLSQLRASWHRYMRRLTLSRDRSDAGAAAAMARRGQEMRLQPYSDVAEAYRTIRTAISFGLGGQPAKTILITSPVAGDGKTTLASNLAISIAQAGRRVLLIDADCRSPKQHKIFGLAESPGLSDVLAGKSRLSEAVQGTTVEKLDVLACGSRVSSSAELLSSPALMGMLKEASEDYDQVLLDSSPVIPISDARILAASCEATILVLRSGKSTRRLADQSLDALESVDAAVLGVVVNDVQRQRGGRYYGYYYGPGRGLGNGNGHGEGDRSSQSIVVSRAAPDLDS